ncbi:MAG: RluA family pseudouridine synthase [Treponema sp.]|nr:RluA family pseudouridine synthase [Candidatus Treponema equifaecale]
MFPPFPQEKAAEVLSALVSSIYMGKISFQQISRPSQERKDQGIMLGALVCQNQEGNTVNLVTNSGIAKILNFNSYTQELSEADDSTNCQFTYVPPIVKAEQIEQALSLNDTEIHRLTEQIQKLKKDSAAKTEVTAQSQEISRLQSKLQNLCGQSLEKVHNLYSFACADKQMRSLKEICSQYNTGKLPPTGTGDCCAPKLLHYAYQNDLIPLSMAELYWHSEGVSAGSPEVAPRSGAMSVAKGGHSDGKAGTPNIQITNLQTPCDSRCGILLPAMLGLRILYRDQHIIIVNKQSGVLSVPGRGPEKQDCIVNRVRRLFPNCIEQPSVHRLDMETSGLLILAFTKEAHKELNRQFENRQVHKEYEALLDGVLAKKGIPKTGTMELFFRLDVDNRPHQIWDAENGKSAITEWEILNVERYHSPDGTTRNATRVRFIPHTGRTHQLRLASADSHGFGVPIIGDTLYGTCNPGERLLLHAKKIRFQHPITGEEMDFTCEPEF